MEHSHQDVCFFNNCRNRDHIALYGSGAFFDLLNSGRQITQARELTPGQACVVGNYAPDNRVKFNWYSFRYVAMLPDEHGELERVFFGRFLVSETLPKSKAASSVRYSALFKVTGEFKQGSVFWKDVPLDDRPVGADDGDASAAKGPKKGHGGAGFGDPIENRLVEVAAIRAVVKDYQKGGWMIRSLERAKCGFDLECQRNTEVQHVEVKGVRSTEQSFIITSNELEQARKDPKFVLIVVTLALSALPVLTRYSGTEFCRRFKLSAVQYRAALQR